MNEVNKLSFRVELTAETGKFQTFAQITISDTRGVLQGSISGNFSSEVTVNYTADLLKLLQYQVRMFTSLS
jgi:hypothetical protein